MKKVFLSVALLGVLISSSCTTKSKKQKMNVIYILADDLGYGDLGLSLIHISEPTRPY